MLLYGSYMKGARLKWRCLLFWYTLFCYDPSSLLFNQLWHPWLLTKWCGCSIVITMIKKWLEIIWYEHKQPYPPTHLFINLIYSPNNRPTYCLSTYLFTYPPMHPPTYLLPIHLHTNPPTHLPTYLPTYTYNLPTCYLSSYNLFTTYFTVCNDMKQTCEIKILTKIGHL